MLRKFEFPELIAQIEALEQRAEPLYMPEEQESMDSLLREEIEQAREAIEEIVEKIETEQPQPIEVDRYQLGYQDAETHFQALIKSKEEERGQLVDSVLESIEAQGHSITQAIAASRKHTMAGLAPVLESILHKFCLEDPANYQRQLEYLLNAVMEAQDLTSTLNLTVPQAQQGQYTKALGALGLEGCQVSVRGQADLELGRVILQWETGTVMLDYPALLAKLMMNLKHLEL